MKKFFKIPAVFLPCAFLAACGAGKEQGNTWMGIGPGSDLAAVTERTEYYDIAVETEELFDLGLWEQNPEEYILQFLKEGEILYAPLGTQFTGGDPIQIWSEVSSGGADIWLYGTDGGREFHPITLQPFPGFNAIWIRTGAAISTARIILR